MNKNAKNITGHGLKYCGIKDCGKGGVIICTQKAGGAEIEIIDDEEEKIDLNDADKRWAIVYFPGSSPELLSKVAEAEIEAYDNERTDQNSQMVSNGIISSDRELNQITLGLLVANRDLDEEIRVNLISRLDRLRIDTVKVYAEHEPERFSLRILEAIAKADKNVPRVLTNPE